eukprot:scaffold44331_cov17-Prasinocladus_malaysianus.AAC.1
MNLNGHIYYVRRKKLIEHALWATWHDLVIVGVCGPARPASKFLFCQRCAVPTLLETNQVGGHAKYDYNALVGRLPLNSIAIYTKSFACYHPNA